MKKKLINLIIKILVSISPTVLYMAIGCPGDPNCAWTFFAIKTLLDVVFWLSVWLQLIVIFLLFFILMAADDNKLLKFARWFFLLIWYVYFLPRVWGFRGWQNWVYFWQHWTFISPHYMQWVCEPTLWLFVMIIIVLQCIFYQWAAWGIKNKNYHHDPILILTLVVLFLVILNV